MAAVVLSTTAAAAVGLSVSSSLPAWTAPGGRVVVTGLAPPDRIVSLRTEARTLGAARSGPLGRFRIVARAPGRGRHGLAVVVGARQLGLGTLFVRPLRFAAVGDVTFGARVASAIARHGPRYPWLSVAPVLRRADLAVANLEGAVSTRGTPVPGKEFHFRGPPAALRAAARFAGIDVVSLANNHTLDFGRIAFLDTIAHARRHGIATVGGGSRLARARRPAIFARGGLRIAVLGFSDVRPPGFDATSFRPGATPAFPELVRADVRAASRRADVVVVYFHWGEERSFAPNPRQRGLAEVALNAGAKVILGAHPHVLQPILRRGRRLVAWSLGNFVFGASSSGTERTGILRLGLGRSGVLGNSLRRARINGVQPRLT